MSVAQRIKEHIEAAIGISVDVSIGAGDPPEVRVVPDSPQAQAAVATIDWTSEAHAAWQENKRPERKSLREAAQQALADNAAFMADASVTQAEAVAQIKRLTQQVSKLIQLAIKD
jgi:siroheme synthase (precorrin-2 oxidase/ferrochelatase)